VQFIRDMKRDLRLDGRLIIATPNADSPMAGKRWRCREPWHAYLLGRKVLREILEDEGMVIEKSMTWGGFPAPRSWWQDIANKVLKRLGMGDVQLVVARFK